MCIYIYIHIYTLYTIILAAATLTTRNTGQARLERRAIANTEVFREAQELGTTKSHAGA